MTIRSFYTWSSSLALRTLNLQLFLYRGISSVVWTKLWAVYLWQDACNNVTLLIDLLLASCKLFLLLFICKNVAKWQWIITPFLYDSCLAQTRDVRKNAFCSYSMFCSYLVLPFVFKEPNQLLLKFHVHAVFLWHTVCKSITIKGVDSVCW